MGIIDSLFDEEIRPRRPKQVIREYGFEVNKQGDTPDCAMHDSELEWDDVIDESDLSAEEIELFHEAFEAINKKRRERRNVEAPLRRKNLEDELNWEEVVDDAYLLDSERAILYEVLKKVNHKRVNG